MAIVLFFFAAMLYYGFQIFNATSVSINFSPRTQVISQVTKLKADPRVSSVDLTRALIPEPDLKTQSMTSSKSATTTGKVCQFGVFGCQQGVSQDDFNALANQVQASLDQQINQTLEEQIHAKHGTQIGSIYIARTTPISTPQVGQAGSTVTVTLSEQGNVLYFLNADATKVAHQALTSAVAQLGQGYHLMDSTITIGAFTLQTIDPTSGVSTLSVAEGAVVRYQFTEAELQTISQQLVGKSLAAATTLLHNQPGIDPGSIQINFTSGSHKSMPSDTQHIKLIPLDPGTLPAVPLTPVSGTAVTPTSATPTPALTPTPGATPIPNIETIRPNQKI
jgi:hypothetical protein